MHYMILMSKKMTSQKKLGEIKSVPYNKPQNTHQKKKVLKKMGDCQNWSKRFRPGFRPE